MSATDTQPKLWPYLVADWGLDKDGLRVPVGFPLGFGTDDGKFPDEESEAGDDTPDELTKAYLDLLPDADALEFLRGPRFFNALKDAAIEAAITYGYTVDECLEEFRRLLALKSFTEGERARPTIGPTPIMDDLWHAAILVEPRFYRKLQYQIGLTLFYESVKEGKTKQERLDKMTTLYKTYFKSEPLTYRTRSHVCREPDPPRNGGPTGEYFLDDWDTLTRWITIYIKMESGQVIELNNIYKNDDVEHVMLVLERKSGINMLDQRLLYGGEELDAGSPLEDYDIAHTAVIQLEIVPYTLESSDDEDGMEE